MTNVNKTVNWIAENNTISNIAYETEQSEISKMIEDGYQFSVCGTPMYDVCGFAVVKFKDKRSGLYKSYKKFMKYNYDEDIDENLDYPCSSRQEKRIHVAIANSIASYLNNKFGNVVYVKSWTD